MDFGEIMQSASGQEVRLNSLTINLVTLVPFASSFHASNAIAVL